MSRSSFALRFDGLSPWLPVAIIAISVLAASLLFLWPAAFEFPMDDAYIHFVYAQNLAEQRRLMFNSPHEKGVGTTSLLWVLLLAGGHALHLQMHLVAKALGIASLIVVGVGLYLLLCPIWRPFPSFMGALLVVLSGNMLWFALSGMETVLFLALGVLALLTYRQERWVSLGIVLGLLPLTRPEGIALSMAIGCVELWRHKGIRRGIAVATAICILVCGPWFGYLLWRTGHVLPTSAVGKLLSHNVGVRLVVGRNESLALLGRFPALIYVGLWIVYLLEFALGGMSLPAPRIPIGTIVDNEGYTLSLWAIAGWAAVILPLLVVTGRRMSALWRWTGWVQDRAHRPVVALLVWALGHNLGCMLSMPTPGTSSRYGVLNHAVLWIALTIGLFSSPRRVRLGLGSGLVAIVLANIAYWNGVYDANLDHMQHVRIRAARFVREDLSPDERCAAFDVGAIRYFSRRPIVDLGGLLDPNAGQWFLGGQFDRYLVENGVTCLVVPGRSGTTDEGWFDLAEIYGLTTTPLFEMHQLAVFEIGRDRWLQGYLPTNNYQAAVTIYRLSTAGSTTAGTR